MTKPRSNAATPISEAESRVMEVLWLRAPLTSEEVVTALQTSASWHEKTIRTLLGRLLTKGALQASRDGRRYLYAPLLTREQWQKTESRSLLDRVFDGRLAPLLTHFTEHEKLTAKDLAELRKLVERIDRKER